MRKKMTYEEVIEEMSWFAVTMLKDKGKEIPLLRPQMDEIKEPWEAAFWTLETLKQNLNEANLCTDPTRAGKSPAHM